MLKTWWQRYAVDQWRMIDEDKGDDARADFKAIVGGVVACLMIVGLNYGAMSSRLQRQFAEKSVDWLEKSKIALPFPAWCYGSLAEHLYWVFGCVIVYLVIPGLVVKLVFREKLSDYGLNKVDFFKHLWIYALLFLPVAACVVLVSFTPSFQNQYPFYRPAVEPWDLLLWECCYVVQFFCLEFFFRGFMLQSLRPRFGSYAILVMIIPYTMIHFQKPLPETLGAILAGVILGTIAMRTKSIAGGFAIHAGVALSMDSVALIHHFGNDSVWHPATRMLEYIPG